MNPLHFFFFHNASFKRKSQVQEKRLRTVSSFSFLSVLKKKGGKKKKMRKSSRLKEKSKKRYADEEEEEEVIEKKVEKNKNKKMKVKKFVKLFFGKQNKLNSHAKKEYSKVSL